MIALTLRFIKNDVKQTWRDGSTRIFLLLPIVFFLLLHIAAPALISAYPVVKPYSALLLNSIVFQGGLLFGFVSGFLLLDEKDDETIQVYRISPISIWQFLTLKMAFPSIAAFIYAIISFRFNPILVIDGWKLVIVAFNFALMSPMLALIVSALGKNKVQGLTFFKAIDLFLIAPFLAFFLPERFEFVFRIFPTFWIFNAPYQLYQGNINAFWENSMVASILAIGFIVFSAWLFKKRIA